MIAAFALATSMPDGGSVDVCPRCGKTSSREHPGARRGGRGETLAIGPLPAAFALALIVLLSPISTVQAHDSKDWIGKRVVQKARNFTLRLNDEPVERAGKGLDVYRVEQSDGPTLFLKAERVGASGWAAALEVVPVEKAIDYFTEQIRARPQDAFPYAMRAFLRHDRKEIDLALRDYDQAITLDPATPPYTAAGASRGTPSKTTARPSPTSTRPSGSTRKTPSPTSTAESAERRRRSTATPSPIIVRRSG